MSRRFRNGYEKRFWNTPKNFLLVRTPLILLNLINLKHLIEYRKQEA